jgi:hypothetical protein
MRPLRTESRRRHERPAQLCDAAGLIADKEVLSRDESSDRYALNDCDARLVGLETDRLNAPAARPWRTGNNQTNSRMRRRSACASPCAPHPARRRIDSTAVSCLSSRLESASTQSHPRTPICGYCAFDQGYEWIDCDFLILSPKAGRRRRCFRKAGRFRAHTTLPMPFAPVRCGWCWQMIWFSAQPSWRTRRVRG